MAYDYAGRPAVTAAVSFSDVSADGEELTVEFSEPIPAGTLLRLEVEGMRFSSEGGAQVVSGSYVDGAGDGHTLEDAAPIETISNTWMQQAVHWQIRCLVEDRLKPYLPKELLFFIGCLCNAVCIEIQAISRLHL